MKVEFRESYLKSAGCSVFVKRVFALLAAVSFFNFLFSCLIQAGEVSFKVEQVGNSNRAVVVGTWDQDGVLGWTWNLCHNPKEVSIGSCAADPQPQSPCAPGSCPNVTCPDDLKNTGPENQGPEFNLVSVFSNGITQSVVLSLEGTWTLPATNRFAMLEITYDFSAGVTCSRLDFCTTQTQESTALLLFQDGHSVLPQTQGIDLCPGACELALQLKSEIANQAAVLLDTCEGQAVTGFQFGLSLTQEGVRIESIEPGAAVENAGGADFWGVRVYEGQGATLGAVLGLEPEGDTWPALPPNTPDQEIARVSLCTSQGEVTAELGFTGELGDPVVPVVVDIDGTSYEPKIGAPVTVVVNKPCEAEAPFVRGDANQDGRLNVSDGVAIARFVFQSGRFRDKIAACQDSADTNDDGEVTLSDALYLLRYLFTKGPAIPDPTGTCGPDPTADSLGCSEFACP